MVDGSSVGAIDPGYLLLVCVMAGDTEEDARVLSSKIVNLRLWPGEGGKINDRSLLDIGGDVLVVSQFTLAADLSHGNRPDYTGAAPRELAVSLCDKLVDFLKHEGVQNVQTGQFGAKMDVALVNDGPVTILLERQG